jgi:hypothetical protein
MAAILAVTAGGCSLTSRNNAASVAAQTPTNEAEWRASLDALVPGIAGIQMMPMRPSLTPSDVMDMAARISPPQYSATKCS